MSAEAQNKGGNSAKTNKKQTPPRGVIHYAAAQRSIISWASSKAQTRIGWASSKTQTRIGWALSFFFDDDLKFRGNPMDQFYRHHGFADDLDGFGQCNAALVHFKALSLQRVGQISRSH